MKIRITYLTLLVLLVTGLSVASYPEEDFRLPEKQVPSTEEDSPDDESLIAFNKMMDVLTHQRCLNCHPSDNIPKQGEDSHPHRFDITRANASGAATNCNTCHQASNNDFSGVPGAPDWALAPHSMRWEGLSRVEIATSMMNRANNGNRSAEDIMHHLTEHELVLWAWEPGMDVAGNPRELPPVSKEDYIAAVKKWIELGAIIPQE
ncbi:MAG: hypothetical protein AAFW00_07590 [Bacteroidota bacterium]